MTWHLAVLEAAVAAHSHFLLTALAIGSGGLWPEIKHMQTCATVCGTDLIALHFGFAAAAVAAHSHFLLAAFASGSRAGPLVALCLAHMRALGQSLVTGLATAQQLRLVRLGCLQKEG